MQSSPVQFSSLSYVTSETPELSLANNSLSVSGAMGGASLAPQLQVINAVLVIKILKCASLWAAQQGLRYCLVSPRQPSGSQGCQVLQAAHAKNFQHEDLSLARVWFAISSASQGMFAAAGSHFLQKASQGWWQRFAEQEFSEHQAKEM